MKNLNYFAHDFQNLENEILFIGDHENVKKFALDWLAAKLLIKENTILWNVCTFEWMNLHEYQGLFVGKSFSSFSHNFKASCWKIEIFISS